jgi:hypothetical protein
MKRFHLIWLAVLLAVLAGNARAQDFKLEQTTYRAIEDVVYGHKDGLALTYDVLTPTTKAKNLGVIILSSGSWR